MFLYGRSVNSTMRRSTSFSGKLVVPPLMSPAMSGVWKVRSSTVIGAPPGTYDAPPEYDIATRPASCAQRT